MCVSHFSFFPFPSFIPLFYSSRLCSDDLHVVARMYAIARALLGRPRIGRTCDALSPPLFSPCSFLSLRPRLPRHLEVFLSWKKERKKEKKDTGTLWGIKDWIFFLGGLCFVLDRSEECGQFRQTRWSSALCHYIGDWFIPNGEGAHIHNGPWQTAAARSLLEACSSFRKLGD